MQAIASLFDHKPTGEVAIELDPRTATAENIKLYKELGFNRVSLGVQDFDTQVQLAINRVQPFELVKNVVQQLHEVGLNHINFDLIYGLPKQTLASFTETLKKTIELNPTRLALFSYAHVPQVKKHMLLIDAETIPSDTEKLEIYATAKDMLEAAGYITIGIDHFAKPDDILAQKMQNRTMKRNFQGYVTDDTDAIIGVGVSAISQCREGYAQATTNSLDYRTWVEEGRLPIVRGYALKDNDRIRKEVIDQLMCFLFVDLEKIREKFSLANNYFQSEINKLKESDYKDIATVDGEKISVSKKYRMAARVVAALFDEYKAGMAGRYSKVA